MCHGPQSGIGALLASLEVVHEPRATDVMDLAKVTFVTRPRSPSS